MTLVRPAAEHLDAAASDELALLAAECLSRLKPGRQPMPLFKELARLVVLSTFELTPLRSSRKNTEVLLAQRPDDDPWWPSQWHLPGTVLLPTKESGIHDYVEPADTAIETDFGGTVNRTSDVIIFDALRRSSVRGSEQTVFGWAETEVANDSNTVIGGKFFDIKSILVEPPREGLVIGHNLTIQKAVASYLSHRR